MILKEYKKKTRNFHKLQYVFSPHIIIKLLLKISNSEILTSDDDLENNPFPQSHLCVQNLKKI